MKSLIPLLALIPISPLFSGQSLVRESGSGTWTIPNTATFNAVTVMRVELRLHDYSLPGTGTEILWQMGPIQLRSLSGQAGVLNFSDDSIGRNVSVNIGSASPADVIIRFQRNPSGQVMTGEWWQTNTGVKGSVSSNPCTECTTPTNTSGANSEGAISNNTGAFAYIRWYTTNVPTTTPIPPPLVTGGNAADYEFEGNLTDSTGNTTMTGTWTYTATPQYPPVSSITVTGTARAGFPFTIASSGYSLGASDPALTYQWNQTAGATGTVFADRTTANVDVSFPTFGQYTVSLRVFDDAGGTAVSTAVAGAVATDSNGVVSYPSTDVALVLGQTIKAGLSPWPFFDSNIAALSTAFGTLNIAGADVWDVGMAQGAGTIAVDPMSTTITGTGTDFQNEYCDGGTMPVNDGTTMAVRYPGDPIDYAILVGSCNSATSITAGGGTQSSLPSAQSGLNHYIQIFGGWWGLSGGNNANYYDNVMSHYNQYYRSGLEIYRTYAEALAEKWNISPWVAHTNPRQRALQGYMLWANLADPSAWDRIHAILDKYVASTSAACTNMTDIREQGYTVGQFALASVLSPDAGKRATYTTVVNDAANNCWDVAKQTSGDQVWWENLLFGVATWNGFAGTAAVNPATNVITGTGTETAWTASWVHANDCVVLCANPTCDPQTGIDSTAFKIASFTDTTLTVDRNYDGSLSGSGLGYMIGPEVCGKGTQPFLLSIPGRAWDWAYSSTSDTTYRDWVVGIGEWFLNKQVNSTARGTWYGREFQNCESPVGPTGLFYDNCAGVLGLSPDQQIWGPRLLSTETFGALGQSYLLTSDAGILAQGDDLFSASYGCDGGPGSDAYCAQELVEEEIVQNKPKNFGFAYGMGGGPIWLAARLGGLTPPNPITISYDYSPPTAIYPTIAKLRLTVRSNAGVEVSTTCTSFPGLCSISVDRSISGSGTVFKRAEWLTAGDAVIATGQWEEVEVPAP